MHSCFNSATTKTGWFQSYSCSKNLQGNRSLVPQCSFFLSFPVKETWEHCLSYCGLTPLCIQSIQMDVFLAAISFHSPFVLQGEVCLTADIQTDGSACSLQSRNIYPWSSPQGKVPCTDRDTNLYHYLHAFFFFSYSVTRGVSHEILLRGILTWKGCYWI